MVHIFLKPSELASSSFDCLIVIGSQNGYRRHFDWTCQDILPVLLGGSKTSESHSPGTKKQKLTSASQDFLQSILAGWQPSPDAGTSTETYIARGAGKKPLKIVLGVLPTSVSRHNSPGQPYAITSLLKKHARLKENTVIAPLCESSDHIFSTVCAISRVGGALMYNRKTTGTGQSGGIVKDTSPPSTSTLNLIFPFAIDNVVRGKFSQLTWGIQLTRRLVDMPCNELHSKSFTDQALELIQGMEHVNSRVIKGQELDEKGFGGLYGVGKAAIHPPAMVILSYEPPSAKGNKSTVLVGKGIVFDTGGLQIKTKAGMPGMKRDMGGAAAILSAFLALVRSGTVSKRPLHAILCLAENAVSNDAVRADDIITLYSGKTVEINNTDAEGRLVLSDGVSRAIKHLNPKVIIDMATLTGAQGIATGKYFGAIYCNDERLEKIAVEAGRQSGDLCHPVPFAPEFFRPEFLSAVAGNYIL
jgi:probable aminopeptidase NPEPL1